MLDYPILSPEEEIKRIVARPPILPAAPNGGIVPAADNAAQAVTPAIAPPTPKVTPVQVPQVPQQRQTDETELNRLKNSPAGVDQLQQKHPIIGTIARIGDVALSSLFPRVAANVPGTEMHHAELVNRAQSRVGNDLTAEQKAAQTANEAATTEHTQAETGAIPAHTKLEEAQADALSEPKPKEENWGEFAGFTDTDGTPLIHEQNSGQVVRASDKKPPTGFKPAEKTIPLDQQYEDAVKKGDADEAKRILKVKHDLAVAGQLPERPGASDARSDRSYQYNQGRLDKLRNPVDQINQRLGRLVDTLAQRNPQADALVAPELLTIMAGGQGSGLRMNEAEISRIVGGRSAWEDLKGKMQHWSTDPKAARSITPDQDRQIRALVQEVGSKLSRKAQVLDAAQERLLDSTDPNDHRRIVAETQKELDAIDGGAGGGGSDTPPPGAKVRDYTQLSH